MTRKIMFIVSKAPAMDTEGLSEAFAQALTALSFGYDCSVFLRSGGVDLVRKGAVEGLKAPTFEPLSLMLEHFFEMGGRIYCCQPAADARHLSADNCIQGVTFINASRLIEESLEADSVISY